MRAMAAMAATAATAVEVGGVFLAAPLTSLDATIVEIENIEENLERGAAEPGSDETPPPSNGTAPGKHSRRLARVAAEKEA